MNNPPLPTANKHWLAGRVKFFYGWVILPVTILATISTSPGQTYMVSVFNPSFRDTLDLTLSQLAGAYMLGTVLAAIPQSYMGVWMDRLGIRRMVLLVTVIFSLSCFFTAQAQNLVMLTISFFLLRAFGQGALSLLSQNMLAMWFRQRLGAVSGIASVITNLITAFIPVGVLTVIKQVGWRNAYILAGAVVLVVMLPLALLIFVNRPEDVGQQVDGDKIEVEATNEQIPETSLDLKQAMRTRAYWIMVAVMIAWAGIITAIVFNLLPIFTGKGLTEEEAAFTFTLLLIISAVGQLIGGYLADRIPLQWLAFSGLTLYTAGVLSLGYASDSWVVLAYTTSVGLGQGFLNGLFSTIWPRYYGREHLGKIRGSIWTVTVAGSSAGPFLMGLAYDHYGDFKVSLLVCAIILGTLAITGLWATPPKELAPA